MRGNEKTVSVQGIELDRRGLLGGVLTVGLAGIAPGAAFSATGRKPRDSDLTMLTASEAASRIRTGDLKAESYVSALISRADRQAALNIFISCDNAALLENARNIDKRRANGAVLGPLAGIPLLVKDNIETKSLTTSAGTLGLKDNRPQLNAAVLERLYGADALLFGKTNMDELAFGVSSNNKAYGPVRNPYDLERTAGGSSGGTAAGIAAHISPIGLGTDTGGSTRIPSSLCGIAGLRPSSGRYPRGGVVPFSRTRDEIGILGRSLDDLMLMDSLIVPEPRQPIASLKGLRLGLPKRYFWWAMTPETQILMDETIRRLKAAGVVFVDVELPGLEDLLAAIGPILAYEMNATIGHYLRSTGSPLTVEQLFGQVRSPDVLGAYKQTAALNISNSAYIQALNVARPRLQILYDECFRTSGVAALMFPATPCPAPLLSANTVTLGGEDVHVMHAMFHNANPASAAGIPGLVLPAGLTKAGLPVGIELDGPTGSDSRLLAIGSLIQKSLPPIPFSKVDGM